MTFKIDIDTEGKLQKPVKKMLATEVPEDVLAMLNDYLIKTNLRKVEVVRQMILFCLRDLGYSEAGQYIKPLAPKSKMGWGRGKEQRAESHE